MVTIISDQTEIPAPAAKVWALYGTIHFADFLQLHLPNIINNVELLEGDGGQGTLVLVTFAPDLGGMRYKEKFVKIDNEQRIKIAEMVEGGYLDLGFTVYRFCFEIIEKDEESCIVKSSVEYELKEEAAANVSLASVQPLIAIAQAAKSYFLNAQQPTDA
ncbi:S-norcoclaurine synthase 2-like [Cucurbita pepo subsp. pepo]|uniref:S-norcoclaurine synthase 2-like n=1 Tax=Cucurbita pepo subsp. pepo TaxID=3664 RepID=UPI000C9D7283|nr:S-norcoclaurine synthase 2-like [Cucurbita pepo subsp. pepo]XP_023521585.1 S-norcoclaurine synthase 2-like [Cucurbita pepo subsp. pepo]